MSEDIFSKKEQAEMVLRLTEAFYASHVHAGAPYVSVAEAVRMAAITLGLALSEATVALTSNARTDPDGYTAALDTFARQISGSVAADQERHASRLTAAISRHGAVTTTADDASPPGSRPAA